jgi:hypothetical protein
MTTRKNEMIPTNNKRYYPETIKEKLDRVTFGILKSLDQEPNAAKHPRSFVSVCESFARIYYIKSTRRIIIIISVPMLLLHPYPISNSPG